MPERLQKFWNWYHEVIKPKTPGVPDLSKDDALEWYEEWKRLGEPDPHKNKRSPDDGFGWDDFFDFIIPTPPFFNLCLVVPEFCKKPDPWCQFT